jgi:glucose-6-phosphate isomerase
MEIKYDYTNALATVVGNEHGLSEAEFDAGMENHAALPARLEELRSAGGADYMNLPYDTALTESVSKLAQAWGTRFGIVSPSGKVSPFHCENFVVVGIGGSSLGGRAVFEALAHPQHNLLPREKNVLPQRARRTQRDATVVKPEEFFSANSANSAVKDSALFHCVSRQWPRMFFPDNIDPESLSGLFEVLDPEETLINVITKSGSTAETVASFMAFIAWFKKRLGHDYVAHVIVTTDSENGALRRIAEREGFETFPVPPGVGGRFSVLSAVGLVPSAFAGIDTRKLLAGAAQMDRRIKESKPRNNPALVAAVIHTHLDRMKNKRSTVLMPYAQCLRATADWFRQLWAESLGKKHSMTGEVVNAGQTPIAALGTTDQHSQIQLYVEGPNDKLITLIEVQQFRSEVALPDLYPQEDALSYLGGRTLNELMAAELSGTRSALTGAQRPNVTITMPAVNEETLGQLLFMLEVQTSYAGMIYSVNPYDQPGVEAGKVAAYALMGRKGYEGKLSGSGGKGGPRLIV